MILIFLLLFKPIYILFNGIKNIKKINKKGGSLRLIILYILDKIHYEDFEF